MPAATLYVHDYRGRPALSADVTLDAAGAVTGVSGSSFLGRDGAGRAWYREQDLDGDAAPERAEYLWHDGAREALALDVTDPNDQHLGGVYLGVPGGGDGVAARPHHNASPG